MTTAAPAGPTNSSAMKAGAHDGLSGDVQDRLRSGDATEESVDHRHCGVEVGTGNRPDGEDDGDERAGGGGGALEELESDIAGAETLSGDAGADHRDHKERRPD